MLLKRVESYRTDLLSLLDRVNNDVKILLLNSFYNFLFDTNNKLLIESYAIEFIDLLLNSINSKKYFFVNPIKIEEFLATLNKFLTKDYCTEYHEKIKTTIAYLELQKEKQISNLNSNFEAINFYSGLTIPFVGKYYSVVNEEFISSVENFDVKLLPTKYGGTINIIPTYLKNETIEKQTKTSLDLSLNYLKEYLPKRKEYDIYIHFKDASANYDGDSIGIALTIGFIIEFTKIYNLPIEISLLNNVAFTGSVNENGLINPIENDIIKQKVEAIFFSPINSFVLPEENEFDAKEKLKELNYLYPKRNLRLIFAKTLYDIFERRSLIEISKQSIAKRFYRNAKSNWVIYLMTLIITLLSILIYQREFDNNPVKFEVTNSGIFIKNSSNITLLHLKKRIHNNPFRLNYFLSEIKLLDVDRDGINEILYSFKEDEKYFSNPSNENGIALLNSKGKILWKRKFDKYVTSNRENLGPPYKAIILDTATINNNICAFILNTNYHSYANCVYILDLVNNKIISDTLWNCGHINDLIRIKDYSNDEEIYCLTGLNNAYESAFLTILNKNNFKGQLPSSTEYQLHNIPLTKIQKSFLFPKTDFLIFSKMRTHGLIPNSTYYNNNQIEFSLFHIFNDIDYGSIIFTYNIKNDRFETIVESKFRVNRDSLVAKGILKPPYTDTKEYRELIQKNILAWDGDKYIPLDEYYKKGVNQK